MPLMLCLPRALLRAQLTQLHSCLLDSMTPWASVSTTRCMSVQGPLGKEPKEQEEEVQQSPTVAGPAPQPVVTAPQVAEGHEQGADDQHSTVHGSITAGTGDDSTPAKTTSALRLRSLADIFKASESEPQQEEDLSYLASRAGASASQQAATQAAQGASAQPPRPGDTLISQQYGYAAISGAVPKDARRTENLMGGVHPHLLPRRMFQPGQTYNPEDLNPYIAAKGSTQQRRAAAVPPSHTDVSQLADYKNVGFLDSFLTPAGKLVSRKASKLPISAHMRVMREIKRARHMGFIAGEARPEKRHLKALRETEARMHQQLANPSGFSNVL